VLAGQGEIVRAEIIRQVCGRQPADHELRQFPRLQALQERARVVDQAQAHFIRGDLAVKQPGPGFGVGEGLGQHVVQFDHLHAPVAHLRHEVEVVTAGVLHP
jgi:hypothetical protein